ncbi:MAG: type IV secretory system conjugative DNA transfer family protein, partial [Acidobacteria bacterium]|nr:type IV secretory system conjugative DNA transfer family protein [Acidobacteriota bacterium]
MFVDRLSHSPLFRGKPENLHTARYAYPYELRPLISHGVTDAASLLLGTLDQQTVLRVTAQPKRPELNNLAVIARTRGGKGLLAKAQILTWSGSLIINDIKGELFDATAWDKARTSDVFVIDTRGVGHRYDPLSGRLTPGELRGIARYLLLEPDEGNGRIFTKRAINMLTALFQAARMEGQNPLVYAGHFLHLGMREAARRLEELSQRAGLTEKDNLATRFLSDPYAEADFDSRFLG